MIKIYGTIEQTDRMKRILVYFISLIETVMENTLYSDRCLKLGRAETGLNQSTELNSFVSIKNKTEEILFVNFNQ